MQKDYCFHIRMPSVIKQRLEKTLSEDPRCLSKAAWILITINEKLDEIERKKKNAASSTT